MRPVRSPLSMWETEGGWQENVVLFNFCSTAQTKPEPFEQITQQNYNNKEYIKETEEGKKIDNKLYFAFVSLELFT